MQFLSSVLKSAKILGIVLCLFGLLGSGQSVEAQELACRVQIDRSQLSGSEFSFLDDLERRIQEYMNTQTWTDDEFLRHERIDCSMQIVILESTSLSTFRSRLIVTTRRPIYGTSQSTTVVRINDPEWRFEYSRGTSLNFDINRYNPLTSVLDFYAYVMIGYDYDTFSELGGSPHFEKARRIADEARGSGDPGWTSTSTQRNRRQLITDLLAQRHRPLRRVYYEYHLNALDQFVEAPEQARKKMIGVLETLQEVNRNLSNSYPLDLFFSAKYQELTSIFLDGNLQDQAHRLLTEADPSHSTEYNKLVQ